MRFNIGSAALVLAAVALGSAGAQAQTIPNLPVLRGLAPVSTLLDTKVGKAALAANLRITGAIQVGALKQPILLPFPAQQQQSLRDAFITDWNAAELADGLGTTLGPVYQAAARYETPDKSTSVSPAIANLIAYTNQTTGRDSGAGKYFFANGTTDKTTPVSPEAAAILAAVHGVTDVFGKAYGFKAGSAGANPYGNSRPFQTEPHLALFTGHDYFGKPSGNAVYLRGPAQNLTASPSYPSGHTTYGYAESVLLAILVPERYEQEITRAAEYGNDRIILGAHYAMDVIGGRTLALYDLAHLLANDPAYVGQPKPRGTVIKDYPGAVALARADMTRALQSGCGDVVARCSRLDHGRFDNIVANERLVRSTLTYGLPVVHAGTANMSEDVEKLAPEAGHLLTAAFPYLTLAQADRILTATEGPGGSFLDDGSSFGVYSRLNLAAAAMKAAALAPPR